MSYGLDDLGEDDLGLKPQRPGEMSLAELAAAVARLAQDSTGPDRDLLEEASARLRMNAMMRDALADRVAEVERLHRAVERLRKELDRLRCGGEAA